MSRPADKPRARKPSKEGAPREPINRFGNDSDMDIDSISDYLSDERKSRSRNTRSLERPLPLSQSQPNPRPDPDPAPDPSPSPFPDPPHPAPHPTYRRRDLIPVNSPPPPPARYPTSPQVVVRTGAGRAANGLRGPPKGDSQAKIIKLVKMDTENLVQWNIRGLRSNYEELKLLLNKTSTSVVALQDCKLGEEQLSPRGYALLRGNCPAGRLLFSSTSEWSTQSSHSTLHYMLLQLL